MICPTLYTSSEGQSWDAKPDADSSPAPLLLDEWFGKLTPLPCGFFPGPISYLNSNIAPHQVNTLLFGVSD